MIPVVDSFIDFSVPDTRDGCNGIGILAEFLRREHSVHVLRAVHASSRDALDDARTDAHKATSLASTPGSGGLPNALVASLEPGSASLETLLDDEALRTRMRAIHVRKTPVGDLTHARLARLAALGVGLEVDSVEPLMRTIELKPVLPMLFRLSPPMTTSDEDASASALDAVRRVVSSGGRVAISVVGLGSSMSAPTAASPSVEALRRTVDRALDAVGSDHVLLSSGYALRTAPSIHETIWSRLTEAIAHRTASERDRLLRQNAIDWYRL